MLVRPVAFRGNATPEMTHPGDVLGGADSLTPGVITTAGDGVWTAAAIASGFIRRSGPGGAYADTMDTATNILAALAGNNPNALIEPGSTFRLIVQNTVAQALTWTAAAGVVAGVGTVNIAASLVREYIVTVLNASPQVILNANTTNASAVVTFNFPTGYTAWPVGGVGNGSINITPGMTVSGTGITAGTKVLGVTYSQAGITGVTLDANATATSAGGVALTFGPTIKFDGLRSGTL